MTKHLYQNRVVDWFVAESVEEAAAMAVVRDLKVFDIDDGDYDFVQTPDDRVLKIDINDDGVKAERTAAEWAALSEKGFLCSTEF